MNPFTIKNGVLFVGAIRILLSKVTSYEVSGTATVIVYFAGERKSLNMGAQSDTLAKALDGYFEIFVK